MAKKIAFVFALIYVLFGIAVVISNYGCSDWVCDIGSYLIAAPWSKFWDAGGPLFLSVGILGKAILNCTGVLISGIIIFYFIRLDFIRLVGFVMGKIKTSFLNQTV